jgi:hypothetical protein
VAERTKATVLKTVTRGPDSPDKAPRSGPFVPVTQVCAYCASPTSFLGERPQISSMSVDHFVPDQAARMLAIGVSGCVRDVVSAVPPPD